MRFMVTNFAYGTGPYLRTTEVALAVNRERESRGLERWGIIVPLVYGAKQRRIMLEQFGEYVQEYPGEILLDQTLGDILTTVFYGDNTYAAALEAWVDTYERASREAHRHLVGYLELETLLGEHRDLRDVDFVIELSRAARLSYRVAPIANVTFGYISEILRHALEEPESVIAVDRSLVRRAIVVAEEIEGGAEWHGLAEPSTFSYLPARALRYPTEEAIQPTIPPPSPDHALMGDGIYVTVTGIPGIERLYREAEALGMKLYSNDPKAIPASERLLPHAVGNPHIKLQFARSGWGSVWLSQLSGTPLVVPDFDPADDPEIYFNNRCVEMLGLGIVWRGQSLVEILADAEKLRPGIQKRNRDLERRFGTLDGNRYAAQRIIDKFPIM